MNTSANRRALGLEWWLVMLIPALTLLAGAAMIYVSASFGFTALAEPVLTAARDG